MTTIKQIYDFAINALINSELKNATQTIKIKIFSDNIVIASRLKLDTVRHVRLSLINFFKFIIFFQRKALDFGILLRGGVTIGELYIDDNFLWGDALIRAYNIENKEAIYPRVLIDRKVEKFITEILPTLPYDTRLELNTLKFTSMYKLYEYDNAVFIDYLDFFLYSKDISIFIKKWEQNLKQQIEINKNNESAMKKLRWQADYHNRFCLLCNNKNARKHMIEIEGINFYSPEYIKKYNPDSYCTIME